MINNEVQEQEETSKTDEASQSCSNPAEVAWQIEKHVDPLHGIRWCGLLKIFLDSSKIENTN